ncbi:hypothetical protein [Streptomyces noursei]|uniref:hypothetical protein n=1 Tax=Streptomyces noursei TaxID=1971 RepID=UPI00167B62E5|nr:hypothetical protein [Streptomyces noursei]MCZ1020142.1 hypothetical protein [Streptomyces noursei]GGX40110.1 hypothetical protein GCM10010341_72640 [Streptomyces noursei]
MDTLARQIDLFTSCKEVKPGTEYDAYHDGMDAAWGTQEAADPSWGIKERAVCKDFRARLPDLRPGLLATERPADGEGARRRLRTERPLPDLDPFGSTSPAYGRALQPGPPDPAGRPSRRG